MSTEQKNNKETEEVDLIVFFNYLGDAFRKVFKFVETILLNIFSFFISIFKVFFKSWKIIISVLIVSVILGFIVDKYKTTTYQTSMLVLPYFETKYQIVTNIDYFNALISNKNTKTLKEIFDVEESVINELVKFEVQPGPENENERKLQYGNFIKQLDSTRAQNYTYQEFLENRDIYSRKFYNITAYAKKNNVFKAFEKGIVSSFTSEFSKKAKKRRDTLIKIQRKNLKAQLKQVDSLQDIYIEVLKEDSKKIKNSLDLGSLSISSEKQSTKEYDLFLQEQRIRDELKSLDEQQVEENEYFDVISTFQKVGNKVTPWFKGYIFLIPALSFLLLCVLFTLSQFVKFTLNYEK